MSLMQLGQKAGKFLNRIGQKYGPQLSTLARKTINSVNTGINLANRAMPTISMGVGAFAPELLPGLAAVKQGLNQAQTITNTASRLRQKYL